MPLTKSDLSKKCAAYCRLHETIRGDAAKRSIKLEDTSVYSYAQLIGGDAGGRTRPIVRAKKTAKAKRKKPAKKAKPARKIPNSANATKGRRAVARGERPPMSHAMATVMGSRSMASLEIVNALKARGWLPNAKRPRDYVSFMLSQNRKVFERVKRGVYRVKAQPKMSPAALNAGVLVQLSTAFTRDDLLAKKLMGVRELGLSSTSQVYSVLNRLVKMGRVVQQTRNHRREWALKEAKAE